METYQHISGNAPKWEYFIHEDIAHGDILTSLNSIGREGWELVSIQKIKKDCFRLHDGNRYFFKRKLSEVLT